MKKLLTTMLCAIGLACSMTVSALATDLPAGVLNYIRQKDPQVKVRFDGVVLFSNGEIYVPVIPQDPSLNEESQQVVMSIPEKAAFPDLIGFDNHFFLLRLIQTSSGRLTFPKMAEYPIQLKEGLLPQDFVMPPNLFIPVELKVILGALPYNPSFEEVKEPPALSLGQISGFHGARLAYVFDMNTQKITAIDPIMGHKQSDITLDCIPSAMTLNPENTLLFVPCLSTNELVVIDTRSNLVKTRVPVGQKPDSVLYLENRKSVVVSNRYSPFLSIVNAEELLTAEKVMLSDNGGTMASGGAMATVPGDPNHLVVADAFEAQVYWVNLTTRTVEKKLKAIDGISAIKVTLDAHAQPEIWVASRTESKVAMLNLTSDEPVVTLDVGKKPVSLALDQEYLFVLSAGDSQLDVIHWPTRKLLEPIALMADSFPSSLALVPAEHKAYIAMAGSTEMAIVDLASKQLENTLPVSFRANMIAMTPDPKAEAEQATVIAKHIPVIQPPEQKKPQLEAEKLPSIGPEAPTESPARKKQGKKQEKDKKPQERPQLEEADEPQDLNAPRVMPVLRPGGLPFGNGINPSPTPGFGQSANQPLNIPLSRGKAKKENAGDILPGGSVEAPPMLDESISR
jgi:DNA-binding beta-propeller fold protein YncE